MSVSSSTDQMKFDALFFCPVSDLVSVTQKKPQKRKASKSNIPTLSKKKEKKTANKKKALKKPKVPDISDALDCVLFSPLGFQEKKDGKDWVIPVPSNKTIGVRRGTGKMKTVTPKYGGNPYIVVWARRETIASMCNTQSIEVFEKEHGSYYSEKVISNGETLYKYTTAGCKMVQFACVNGEPWVREAGIF